VWDSWRGFLNQAENVVPSNLSPTRLVQPFERPQVLIARPATPSRLRSFHILISFASMVAGFVWLRLTGRFSRRRYGRRVRQFLEQMGTLWIRAGQILALRSDVFSVEFCEELAQLRDKGTGIPFAMVKEIVESELAASIDTCFDEFEEQPFNVTTISQVHMAHLRHENVWVAVNVQRPYARWTFEHDAALIRRVVRLLQAFSIHPNMRWNDLCAELDSLMTRELDYRYEASSVRHLRKKLRKHGVDVHRVFTQYTSRRVLVTEFIRGALMSDYVHLSQSDPAKLAGWLATNNINSEKLSRRLFRSVFRQIFEDNVFHADLVPGNIILLRNSQFSVLDTRNVGSLESENLAKYRKFFEALTEQNYTIAADIFLFLASKLPVVEIAEVKSQLVRAFRSWETRTHIRSLPFRDRSLSKLLHELNIITFRYKFETQWSMSKLARTWANLDASLECLAPDMNYLKEMRKYFRAANRRDDRRYRKKALRRVAHNLVDALEFPKQLAENDLFRQTIIRRQAQVFQGSTNKIGAILSGMFGLLAFGTLLAGAFLATAFLDQHYDVALEVVLGNQLSHAVSVLPQFSFWAWIAILLLVFGLFRVFRRLTKSFRQKEVRVPEARPAV